MIKWLKGKVKRLKETLEDAGSVRWPGGTEKFPEGVRFFDLVMLHLRDNGYYVRRHAYTNYETIIVYPSLWRCVWDGDINSMGFEIHYDTFPGAEPGDIWSFRFKYIDQYYYYEDHEKCYTRTVREPRHRACNTSDPKCLSIMLMEVQLHYFAKACEKRKLYLN